MPSGPQVEIYDSTHRYTNMELGECGQCLTTLAITGDTSAYIRCPFCGLRFPAWKAIVRIKNLMRNYR